MSTDKLMNEATVAVIEWIAEYRGEEAAEAWTWNCTPIPCWLPNQTILDEGMNLALGNVTLQELIDKAEMEVEAAMQRLPVESSGANA